MNPYSILSQIGAINAQRATLVKQDGRRIELLVKPESGVSETVGGQTAPGAIAVRTWSTGADEKSVDLFPGAGDRLEIADESTGEILSYATTRDATTGRYWSWRYLRRGVRIVFYTKYNPDAPRK